MNIKFPQLFKRRIKQAVLADICLIVHGKVLLHAERQDLVAQHDESLLQLTPTELAAAVRRLLPNTDKQQRIALALPNEEFVATPLTLPAIAANSLRNAVMLQLPTLLPGVSEPLLLSVQAHEKGGQTVALWMPAKRAEDLFQAFDKEGLFLSCVLPRAILALPAKSSASCQVYDEDEQSVTCFTWSGSAIQQWLYVPKSDCDSVEFKGQLEHALEHLLGEFDINHVSRTSMSDWEDLPMPPAIVYGYAFVPPSTTARMAQMVLRKKRRWRKVMVGFLVFLLLLGVAAILNYENRLKKYLAGLRDRTADTTRLQSQVLRIEEMIAPIKKFPRQDVTKILDTLDKLVSKDSWMTSFRIEAGLVEIEGYSPNPAQLLEVLAKQPEFSEVGFSRATRSESGRKEESFGIRFKLKEIDVPTYWVQFFAVEH